MNCVLPLHMHSAASPMSIRLTCKPISALCGILHVGATSCTTKKTLIDAVSGPDRLTPIVMNLGLARTVDLDVIIKSPQGDVIKTEPFANVNLAAGRTVTDLSAVAIDGLDEGYYVFEYHLEGAE